MESVSHEPWVYTSKLSKTAKVLNLGIGYLFGLITLGLIIFGIYSIFLGGDFIIAAIASFIIGIVLGFIAWVGYSEGTRNKVYEYQFELNSKGIDEKRIYKKKNKAKENHIAFEDMGRVLIGNYVDTKINPNGKNFFKFGVLVIIMYQGEYFFQRIFKANELTEWLIRLSDKNCSIYYTEFDLKQAFIDHNAYDIDFSQIEGVPWEEVEELPPVEHEMFGNPFVMWHDDHIEELKKKAKITKTQKVDRNVTAAIFLYGIFTGIVIMPALPLEDGIFEITDLFLLAIGAVNMLIPFFIVYWRSYTKWYMPVIYFLAATAGNCIALLLVSLFSDIPNLYGAAIFTNIMILIFLWYPALIFMKLGKLVIRLMDKFNLG